VKNLAELQAECAALGIKVETNGRASKEPYFAALRDHHWQMEHPGEPVPTQVMPMLLDSWEVLGEEEAQEIETDLHAWLVQPKLDGVRALLHIEEGRVRITGRTISEVSYRLSEFQENLLHLSGGWSTLTGTILDGELVCPVAKLDTGSTLTESSLQATTAILATSPENARHIQDGQAAHVRFHAFDVLSFCGRDVTPLPLIERQDILEMALRQSANQFVETVPSFVVNKPAIHRNVIARGGEGTVWKKASAPYEPGRRVSHWIKLKAGVQVEAFVSGFKPGNNGHSGLIGAIEFSSRQTDGSTVSIGWVNGWTDQERSSLSIRNGKGQVTLDPRQIGRRAIIEGQGLTPKSRRLRHARLRQWLDAPPQRT
jgi:bifunctional non-homologous end joining protein LigD